MKAKTHVWSNRLPIYIFYCKQKEKFPLFYKSDEIFSMVQFFYHSKQPYLLIVFLENGDKVNSDVIVGISCAKFDLYLLIFFNIYIYFFNFYFIYLFIFGCVGSSILGEGFL